MINESLYPLWLRVSRATADPDSGFHVRAVRPPYSAKEFLDLVAKGRDPLDGWTSLQAEPILSEPDFGLTQLAPARLEGFRMTLRNIPQELLERALAYTEAGSALRMEAWAKLPMQDLPESSWCWLTAHHGTHLDWEVHADEQSTFTLRWLASPAADSPDTVSSTSIVTMVVDAKKVPTWCVA